eukprot:TRINITY_DN10045_c0_g1_i1.p1 TRINITY_DN10045_c0_g1~~TRINITY_DN10045_c0_g1_i1.p1  ORF type:complete len:180 (+),score=16.07 TRINITY_DN10045_c0_g1_i1:99-638(+)
MRRAVFAWRIVAGLRLSHRFSSFSLKQHNLRRSFSISTKIRVDDDDSLAYIGDDTWIGMQLQDEYIRISTPVSRKVLSAITAAIRRCGYNFEKEGDDKVWTMKKEKENEIDACWEAKLDKVTWLGNEPFQSTETMLPISCRILTSLDRQGYDLQSTASSASKFSAQQFLFWFRKRPAAT